MTFEFINLFLSQILETKCSQLIAPIFLFHIFLLIFTPQKEDRLSQRIPMLQV